MAKRNQQQPAKNVVGRNNPRKSTPITTGTYKKPSTTREQRIEHEPSDKMPQESRVPPLHASNPGLTKKAQSQVQAEEHEQRSGSDSNANKHRKRSRVHDHNRAQREPGPHPEEGYDFSRDLHPNEFAGENNGAINPPALGATASDMKGLYGTLADLTDDELQSIVILPEGTRLEQGAKYIDLSHLEQGEFVALAHMVAEPGHAYVSKKETDYVLWNRLNQIEEPPRLDQTDNTNV